jgi:hypothetical protein
VRGALGMLSRHLGGGIFQGRRRATVREGGSAIEGGGALVRRCGLARRGDVRQARTARGCGNRASQDAGLERR